METESEHLDQPVNSGADVLAVIQDTLSKIADCFDDEELNEEYSKKDGKVNWIKLRGLCKKQLAKDLKDEWTEMWEDEKLTEKIDKLREIRKNTPVTSKRAWRPKVGDIGPQKLALEKIRLMAKREQLEAILKEKQDTVTELKSKLSEKWEEFRGVKERLPQHRAAIEHHRKEIDSQSERLYQSLDNDIPVSNMTKLDRHNVSSETVDVGTHIPVKMS